MYRYNLFGSVAGAIGALCCGIMLTFMIKTRDMDNLTAYRRVMLLYSLLQCLLIAVTFNLSSEIEVPTDSAAVKKVNPVSLFLGLHKSKLIVLKLSCLFLIDSFAGSFVLQSLISGLLFIENMIFRTYFIYDS